MNAIHLAVAGVFALAPLADAQDLYDLSTYRKFELKFAQLDYWQQLEANFELPTRPYIAAELKVDGVRYPNVGVRFRGNSSYYGLGPTNRTNPPPSAWKKPFKIKMNEFVPGQRLMGYETINLNNNFLDPSWIREVATYRILRRYMPAPKSNFVRLKVNRDEWGPYINTEQPNRDLLQEWFVGTDGNRYKAKRELDVLALFSSLRYLGPTIQPYDAGFDIKTNARPNAWTDLINVCDVLDNTPPAQRTSALPVAINVDNALWYLAGMHALVTLDGYTSAFCHNYYVLFDSYDGRANFAPWDQNLAFGTGRAAATASGTDPFYKEHDVERPLINVLLQVPRWRARYRHHVRTVFEESYDWATLGPDIAELRNLIDSAVQSDPRPIYTYQQFVDNLTRDVTVDWWNPYPNVSQSTAAGIRPLVEGRHAFLSSHPDVVVPVNGLSELRLSPARPSPSDALSFTVRMTGASPVSRVSLYYRTQGAPFSEVTMRDDGRHGDGAAGDGVFGTTVPRQPSGTRVEYYAGLEMASTGAMNFAPSTASHLAPNVVVDYPRVDSDLVINEFLALNNNGLRDSAGERDDWIELINRGSRAIDASGMYLTDDLLDPTQWRIPAGTRIDPGDRLLIWADEDLAQGPLHASFKLSGSGEGLYLFAADGGTILDEIRFGQQLVDVSTGRRRDGEPRWVTLFDPTPDASNELGPCGMRRFSFVDPTVQPVDLRISGQLLLGSTISFRMRGGQPGALHAVFVDVFTSTIPLGFSRSILLLGPAPFVVGSALGNATGSARLTFVVPDDPNLLGRSFYYQSWALDSSGGAEGSNAAEVRYCR